MHKVKKLLMTISMTLAFSFTILGTGAYAVSNKTSSGVSSQAGQNTEDNKEDKTNSDKKNSTSTVDKNTSNKDKTESEKEVDSDKDITSADTDDDNENQTPENIIVPEKIVPHWEYINGYLHYVTEDGIVEKQGWFKEKEENPDADNDNEYYL